MRSPKLKSVPPSKPKLLMTQDRRVIERIDQRCNEFDGLWKLQLNRLKLEDAFYHVNHSIMRYIEDEDYPTICQSHQTITNQRKLVVM